MIEKKERMYNVEWHLVVTSDVGLADPVISWWSREEKCFYAYQGGVTRDGETRGEAIAVLAEARDIECQKEWGGANGKHNLDK